ncbi:MAG: Trm112 family protein [Pseudomonadota bacterium]
MKPAVMSILCCPLCKARLHYAPKEQVLVCRPERLAFPVIEGRPILMAGRARSLSVEDTDRLAPERPERR